MDLALPLLMAVISISYAILVASFLRKRQLEKPSEKYDGKPDFFKALINGLKRGTVVDLVDIENIYKGINGITSERGYREDLSIWLREFLVYLIAENAGPTTYYYLKVYDLIEDEELPTENIPEYKKIITNFIKQNESLSPFSELPDAERGILSDIVEFSSLNDHDRVLSKLHEISGVIREKQNAFRKIEASNRWAIPLAIAGVFLTISFGVLPLILGWS